ncbi:Bacterial regulatory proteins, deoR family [Kluyvera intermedia]|nr:Bacterial regulatory proteins, deoR family [Kluyvera intermedia]
MPLRWCVPVKPCLSKTAAATRYWARELATQPDVTIITVSSYIAHLLKETPGEVILLGGIYQKKSESMVGAIGPASTFQQVHFSKAFIGIGWLAAGDRLYRT